MVTVSLAANPYSGSEQTKVVVTARPWKTSDVKVARGTTPHRGRNTLLVSHRGLLVVSEGMDTCNQFGRHYT